MCGHKSDMEADQKCDFKGNREVWYMHVSRALGRREAGLKNGRKTIVCSESR